MINLVKKILGLNGNKLQQMEDQKAVIIKGKQDTLKSLQKLNKKFRFTIESGQIEVIIKDVTDITKGK